MHIRLFALALATTLLLGCGSPGVAPPPIVVESSPYGLRSLYADSTFLYFSGGTDLLPPDTLGPYGIYKINLKTGVFSLLIEGVPCHVRQEGAALVAVICSDEETQLVRIPFDGSAVTSEPLPADVTATASADGYTFSISRMEATPIIRTRVNRMATDTEPGIVLLETRETATRRTPLLAMEGQLYWHGASDVMRIADDGSESDMTWLRSWADFPAYGTPRSGPDFALMGAHDGEMFGLLHRESLFRTGTSSNGDPKGYYDFGGGAIYTVGTRPGTDPAVEGRTVRGDIRAATLAEGFLYAQTTEGDILRIDAETGAEVLLPPTPHLLSPDARLVTNGETLFYNFANESTRRQAIHALSLLPVSAE